MFANNGSGKSLHVVVRVFVEVVYLLCKMHPLGQSHGADRECGLAGVFVRWPRVV